MRIWSFHPQYLDSKGLVALWRETLLAQKVLMGETKGYKFHPQLDRFKKQTDPIAAIGVYLYHVSEEARKRGYKFDADKITFIREIPKIKVTTGQITYEFQHLLKKLITRDPLKYEAIRGATEIKPHPLFKITKGNIEQWEKL